MKQIPEHPKIKLINFPVIHDRRGNLSFIEGEEHLPYDIKRVYYLYDVPSGANRGAHAHINTEETIVALAGSFDVILDDGLEKKRYHLNRPQFGLKISPGIWRELDNFSSCSVCLVLASEKYDEDDYIRNYKKFLASVKKSSKK